MKYPGAKKRHIRTLINQIPPHGIYIEPFLGSGALMERKAQASVNIGIDIDRTMIDRFTHMKKGKNYQFHCVDAIEFLSNYDFNGDEFLYVDPPYLQSTRSAKKIYRHELDYERHLLLLDILLAQDAKVMLAGYQSPLYESRLTGWRQLPLPCKAEGSAMEVIWMNYPKVAQLQDYRYIGENFREREKYKRRQAAMRRCFEKMTDKEQAAFMSWIMNEKKPLLNENA